MSYSQTLERLKTLRLHGMAEALENLLNTRQSTNLSSEQIIELLVQQEYDERYNRKIERLTQQAKFRYHAMLESVKPDPKRNLDATQLAALATCNWITKGENLLISGPTGVGKSYLATALGQQACTNGYKVMYYNSQKLFYNLKMARLDGTHRKIVNQIAKTELLILDDFGLQKLDDTNRLDLLEIIEDRHGLKSTLIAAQVPSTLWYDLIGEPTISDAILDRLTSKAHRIELKGDSRRK
jgi:DNA replication protein DnaC